MAKIQPITKKTHAYILPEFGGVIVRAISETHVTEYQKDKKTVYQAAATKLVDGKKIDTVNYYVAIDDFVKRTTSRASLASKLAAATTGIDLNGMTAAQLLALIS
jgi:hypothetical protein